MKFKYIYLLISAVIIVPGIISLFLYGLNLSIDFTGGSVFKYKFDSVVAGNDISVIFEQNKAAVEAVSFGENNTVTVRTKPVDSTQSDSIKKSITEKYPNAVLDSFETVGPAIGKETTKNAFVALGWVSLGIVLYIAYAFRNVPKPYSSYRFGVSAVVAVLHDMFLLLGVFSILGKIRGVEVDSLFITAVLTLIGFSVHDTIVVFDRIRENLRKLPNDWGFERIVNYSIVETLARSIVTSLTVILTLFSLFVLGGDSIKTFVLALLIGIVTGTYSSIFNAAPILVIWEDYILKKKKK